MYKMKNLLLAIPLFCFFNLPLSAEISLPYGEGDGKVAFYNQVNNPDAEELHPIGPLAFRYLDGEFWVLDSLGGKLLRISGEGKIVANIHLPETSKVQVEDFAFVRGKDGKLNSLYLLYAENQEIIQITPEGKLLRKFGGIGDDPGKFRQFCRIETTSSGAFCVADRGKQTLTVFSPEARPIREVHWEWSGFCFDPKGSLCRLVWDEDAKVNHLIVETLEGKKEKEILLEIGDHTNPDLLFVDADHEATMLFIPPEGFKGKYKMAICDGKGKPVKVGDLVPPKVMNRFLEKSGGAFFLAEADFELAPKGSFKIVQFSLK